LKGSVSHLLPVHNVIIHSVPNATFMIVIKGKSVDSMQNYMKFSRIVKYLNLSEIRKLILPRTQRDEGIYPTNQKCFSDENDHQKKKQISASSFFILFPHKF
jgi:hypothetical protein